MPVEMMLREGATVGRKKHINEVNILFHESVCAKVGLSFDGLESIRWRTDEPYGVAPRAFSGIRSAVVPGMAKSQVSICIRSDEPTPLTVQAIMAKIEVK
jgi:hypothetical protein